MLHSEIKFWLKIEFLCGLETSGGQTDVRQYNFFLVRHKSRTKFDCTAVQKDVRL